VRIRCVCRITKTGIVAHTLIIFNAYCFCTAITVTRTRPTLRYMYTARLFTPYYNQTVKSMYIHNETVNRNKIRSRGLPQYFCKLPLWRGYSLPFQTLLQARHMSKSRVSIFIVLRSSYRSFNPTVSFFSSSLWHDTRRCWIWKRAPAVQTQRLYFCVYMTLEQLQS